MTTPKTLLDADRAEALVLAQAVQHSAAGIVSRTVLQSPELRVVLFAFAEGQELTLHSSRRRALVQILEGSCLFFYNEQWQRLAAGTVLHLPPNHPHAVKAASGSFSMLLTLGTETNPSPIPS
jgi:quercetin dioxygenase-like cupin family protein